MAWNSMKRRFFFGVLAACGLAGATAEVVAQIEITEIMYDSADTPTETPWEWVEIRNTSNAAVDLHDWVFGDRASRFGFSNINNGQGDTVVPSGGVAVIYNSPLLASDPTRFTDAWGSGIQLIPVNSFGSGLNNGGGGDRIGLWSSYASYNPGGGTPTAEPFWENAVSEIDYSSSSMTNPFPGVGSGGKSIAWKGTGVSTTGSNWIASAIDDDYGAYQSTLTTIEGALVNSTSDAGTPGLLLQGGTAPAGKLLITEIMYNPRSNDDQFEWVEFVNNTGAAIDFGVTPYVFDDFASAVKTGYNITSGAVSNGGIGVLVDIDGLTSIGVGIEDLEEAWENNAGTEINFIPVTGWQDLNNNEAGNGDPAETIGLWDDLAEYTTDYAAGRFNWTLAKAQATYNDDPDDGWEFDDGDGSIFLNDLGADGTLGSHWTLSGGDNDTIGVVNPDAITANIQDHDGLDVGSPGFVPSSVVVGQPGDFNDDGIVDAEDYTVWRDHLGGNSSALNGNGSGGVTVVPADYDLWKANFGEGGPGSGGIAGGAVPEPTSAVLMLLALLGLAAGRRSTR